MDDDKSPLRVLIVDDEEPSIRRMEIVLADCNNLVPHTVVGRARNGMEAVDIAGDLQPDVVFLDIRMPGMNGIEAAGHLNRMAKPPSIIFTTAYDDYALEAFAVHAIDYLLKPIRTKALADALGRVQTLNAGQLAMLAESKSGKRTHFSVRLGAKVILVPVRDVTHLESDMKYTIIHTKDAEYEVEESLKSYEQEYGDDFVRISRSCLVARRHLTGFQRIKDKAWVAMLRGLDGSLPVSRRMTHVVLKFLDNGRP